MKVSLILPAEVDEALAAGAGSRAGMRRAPACYTAPRPAREKILLFTHVDPGKGQSSGRETKGLSKETVWKLLPLVVDQVSRRCQRDFRLADMIFQRCAKLAEDPLDPANVARFDGLGAEILEPLLGFN
jgi:hypothetical protein